MSLNYKHQIEQVIELLKVEKMRKPALDLLLSISENSSMADVFIELEIPKLMVRMVESEDIGHKETILQIMINLSTNEKYINSFLSINTFHRILSLVFKLVSSSLQKDQKTFNDPNDIIISNDIILDKNGKEFDVKFEMDKYVINIIQTVHPDNINESLITLYFMFLSNLSSYESGQKKILDIDNEKIKGIVFFKLLDKFFEYIYHNSFDFCSGVIANVSSLKEGRELILSNKIFKIFLIQFDKMNKMKIINILRFIRNCCFEYEKYTDELLVKDGIMFSYLTKVLVMLNDKDKGSKLGIDDIDIIYFNNFNTEMDNGDKETICDLIIDIFLILTNHQKAVDYMKSKGILKAVKVVEENIKQMNNMQIENKVKDRLMVIKNYLE